MTKRSAVRVGDTVRWNDPDDGLCSRTLLIVAMTRRSDGSLDITDEHGDSLECFPAELELNVRLSAKLKITPRQKEAFRLVRESGEMVVIEDDWLIYLAVAHTMPFGLRSTWQQDCEAVRSTMTRLDDEAVLEYLQDRMARAGGYGEQAIEHIRAGRYDDARESLKQAEHHAVNPASAFEVYRMPEVKG